MDSFKIEDLNAERRNEIEKNAERIRKAYNLSIRFDLIDFLTEQLNYEIQLRKIDDDTTGLLFINEYKKVIQSDAHYVIVINSKLLNDRFFKQKRRFICAHEYGHAILHKGNSQVFARRDTEEKNTIEEIEAEYFAYCLLMPKDTIDLIMNDEGLIKIINNLESEQNISFSEVIARLFNVTPKKAENRLCQLRYV